eukprot:m.145922 g.145922  ORF g.145922 m.145922 type:complete len:259 (+) comp17235_c0_seq2:229-1005(+)
MGDRARITGPAESVAVQTPRDTVCLADGGSSRKCGRNLKEPRKIFLQNGVVTQARGSAYIEMGQTKVTAACYGPRDHLRTREYSAQGKLDCVFKFAPFACRTRRAHQQDAEEKELSAVLEQALAPSLMLHKYPKSVISVFVTVVEDDGSALAAAITCASVGLAEAGIEMFDFVSGATVGWAEQRFFYDATAHEEETADALLTIAFMPSLGEISSIFQTGQLPAERQAEAVDQAVGGCNQTRNIQVLSLQHLVDADASA